MQPRGLRCVVLSLVIAGALQAHAACATRQLARRCSRSLSLHDAAPRSRARVYRRGLCHRCDHGLRRVVHRSLLHFRRHLRFKPSSLYHIAFSVDSMYVGNGYVLKRNDIEVVNDPAASL